MRGIHLKMWFVIVLTFAAAAVTTAIYMRRGFSITANEPVCFCGTVDPAPITDKFGLNGQQLFKSNCTSFHAMDREVVGPALIGIRNRMPDTLIERFVLFPKQTLHTNKYLKNLYIKYDNLSHPYFLNILTKDDIYAITRYCDFYQPQPVATKIIP